ncbi:hypothetical protein [Actinoplanes sp. NPDC026619]|uniref:hypothetical protein n=1 Tax=Actinoplanes sp. NPDC026619 TaxID=3155798 RepID=UPI0033E55606
MAAVISFAIYRYSLSERRRQFENVYVLGQLAATPASNAGNPLELNQLWLANRDRLNAYHHLTQSYASSSRQLTIFTLLAGFFFLLLVGGTVVFVHSTAAAVAASVIAAGGAALTGYIGNTVLRNANASSHEVLAFFAHPLEVERFLSAERLVAQMPAESRPAALTLIVQALTRTTDPATPTTEALDGEPSSAG